MAGIIVALLLALAVVDVSQPVNSVGEFCEPCSFQMWSPIATEPVSGVFEVHLLVSPTDGLTTREFGLTVTNSTHARLLPGTAPASCAAPVASGFTQFTAGNCGAPVGNWYAVLLYENDTVASVFGVSESWSGASIMLSYTLGISLAVVSGTEYSGVGYTLSSYGTGASSVSGEVEL